MGERWGLSRRELAAWVAIVLLVPVSVWSLRPQPPKQESVRVVQPEAAQPVTSSPARLDLNRASDEELQMLPGIGTRRARQIVDFRRQHGAFQSVNELGELPGFSKALVERLAPLLTVEPVAPAKR